MLTNFALDDAFFLGVLSSRIHVVWALASGGTLENRPRYNKTRCFDPFPLPNAIDAQRQIIRDPAERLDAHRKQVLAAHQDLTLTGFYNVLEKLRAGEALTPKEQDIHERGLVSVMKHLHDQIDAAVFDAYGWPRDLSDEEILARLVELNKERRAEEVKGLVRWLRPEYQAPAAKTIVVKEQGQLDITRMPSAAVGAQKTSWPKTLPERITGIRGLLAAQPKPAHAGGACAPFPPRPARRCPGGPERPGRARPRPPPRRQPLRAVESTPTRAQEASLTIRLHPHAAARMAERGATPEEVEATVAAGERFPARFGRTGFRRNFAINGIWRRRRYRTKQIEAYAVEESGGWLVITVIVKYF